MTLDQLIILARKHIGGDMESSARFCLQSAIEFRDNGFFDSARMWALKSLDYSIGIFHPDHKRARQGLPKWTINQQF